MGVQSRATLEADWREELHPRFPAGDKRGGQFAPKGSGGGTGLSGDDPSRRSDWQNEAARLNTKLVELHGETHDVQQAGWMLTDGRMLPWVHGTESYDNPAMWGHAATADKLASADDDFAQVYDDFRGNAPGYGPEFVLGQSTGAVRMVVGGEGGSMFVQFFGPPSAAQKRMIARIAKDYEMSNLTYDITYVPGDREPAEGEEFPATSTVGGIIELRSGIIPAELWMKTDAVFKQPQAEVIRPWGPETEEDDPAPYKPPSANAIARQKRMADVLIQHFGETSNAAQAGWLMADGRLLDMENRAKLGEPDELEVDTELRGRRNMHHGEVAEWLLNQDDQFAKFVQDYNQEPGPDHVSMSFESVFGVATGSVRINVGDDKVLSVEVIQRQPTPAQIRILNQIAKDYGMERIDVDITTYDLDENNLPIDRSEKSLREDLRNGRIPAYLWDGVARYTKDEHDDPSELEDDEPIEDTDYTEEMIRDEGPKAFGYLTKRREIQAGLRVLEQDADEYHEVTDYPMEPGRRIWIAGNRERAYDSQVIEYNEKDNSIETYDAYDWIRKEADEQEIEEEAKFQEEFWEYPGVVYHATSPDRAASILRNGLKTQNESRGFSNRSVGSAVYTHREPEVIGRHYGGVILGVDLEAMKADGYMPTVSREPDIVRGELEESIARAIGLDDFSYDFESGMDPDTVVFHDKIPSKYLWVEEGQNELDEQLELEAENPDAKVDDDFPAPVSPRESRIQTWNDKLAKQFGETKDPESVGWLLSDGSMLNKFHDSRLWSHRSVARWLSENDEGYAQVWARESPSVPGNKDRLTDIEAFGMQTAAVRIQADRRKPSLLSVQCYGSAPNAQQIRQIKQLAKDIEAEEARIELSVLVEGQELPKMYRHMLDLREGRLPEFIWDTLRQEAATAIPLSDDPSDPTREIWRVSRDEYAGTGEGYLQRLDEWNQAAMAAISEGVPDVPTKQWESSVLKDYVAEMSPVPPVTYHATAALSSILERGLQSRYMQGDPYAGVLGGGGAYSVSVTPNRQQAEQTAEAIRDAVRICRGEITLRDLVRRAAQGDAGSKPFDPPTVGKGYTDGDVRKFNLLMEGRMIEFSGLHKHRSEVPDNWEPIPESKIEGAEAWSAWTRPGTPEEVAHETFDRYSRWFLPKRWFNGGPEDPVFVTESSQFNRLRQADPADVGVVEITTTKPLLGAYNYREDEFKIFTSRYMNLRDLSTDRSLVSDDSPAPIPRGLPAWKERYASADWVKQPRILIDESVAPPAPEAEKSLPSRFPELIYHNIEPLPLDRFSFDEPELADLRRQAQESILPAARSKYRKEGPLSAPILQAVHPYVKEWAGLEHEVAAFVTQDGKIERWVTSKDFRGVTFSREDAAAAVQDASVLVHNHTTGGGLSKEDVLFAARAGLRAATALTIRDGRIVAITIAPKKLQSWPDPALIEMDVYDASRFVRSHFEPQVILDQSWQWTGEGMSPEEASVRHWEEAWRWVTLYGRTGPQLHYEVTDLGPMGKVPERRTGSRSEKGLEGGYSRNWGWDVPRER